MPCRAVEAGACAGSNQSTMAPSMRSPITMLARLRAGSGSPDESEPGHDTPLFDWPFYQAITQARLDHLETLDLDIEGRSVLDVGSGIGRLSEFFAERGCDVMCIDGRAENVEELCRLYTDRRAAVVDVETDELASHGSFDIVFCYGLLYHLADPFAFLGRAAGICRELLILETCVTDAEEPLVHLVADPDDPTMALNAVASRPSPSYVAAALQAAGLEYVYTARRRPDHPDFSYRRLNDLSYVRDGRALREIFVAAREPLGQTSLQRLSPAVPSGQP